MRYVGVLPSREGDMRVLAPLLQHPIALVEHPIEAVIAGLLLVALLFVTGGPEPATDPAAKAPQTIAQKS